jgi:hypothetical protein
MIIIHSHWNAVAEVSRRISTLSDVISDALSMEKCKLHSCFLPQFIVHFFILNVKGVCIDLIVKGNGQDVSDIYRIQLR